MNWPSGGHLGLPAKPAEDEVKGNVLPPSAPATQICRTPPRLDVNAIRFSSASTTESLHSVEERNRSGFASAAVRSSRSPYQ
jgi:hypothetical protein